MPRLVTINTHPMTTRVLLRGQLGYMRESGFDVVAISSPGWEFDDVAEQEGVQTVAVPMEREIRPWRDLVSLVRLLVVLRRLRPDIVHTGTPKASLLGMVAAALLRVPVRIYTVRGLRLETTRGLKRRLLSTVERLTSWCASRVFCESNSLRQRCVELRLVPASKADVVGPGLPNGLDYERYGLESHSPEETQRLREQLGIPAEAQVIGFVGRFVRDKGIVELSIAFNAVLQEFPNTHLLLIGDFESGDPVPDEIAEQIRHHSQIVLAGYVPDVAPYYPLMNVHVLPSYREGFPNSPMEAAACEVPTVGFLATGTVDAVVDGVTGVIVPCGDAKALAAAMINYLADPELRHRHGVAARQRVKRDFRREPIWEAMFQQYVDLLKERGLPVPASRVVQEESTCRSGSA